MVLEEGVIVVVVSDVLVDGVPFDTEMEFVQLVVLLLLWVLFVSADDTVGAGGKSKGTVVAFGF